MSHLGGGEEAALTIWKQCGVKVIPGVYLAHEDRHGINPGRDFVRVALVHDVATVREALERIVELTRNASSSCMAYRGDDPAPLLPASLERRLEGWLWKCWASCCSPPARR